MWLEYVFMGIMGLMSLVGLYVFFERLFFYKRINLSDFSTRARLEKELTRGLYVLASVASNAPYVGLMGTVLGIMQTFYIMGKEGMGDTLKIMTGLALALKATALGLLVAVPATVLYNYLVRRARELLYEWEEKHARKGD
ncbi:MAG: TonB-system energizer ExbB [Aquificaceae bacterium]|jgi:biopolymer transport protein ExbB|uniref:TonB-system energizer ExbB n=1 Tax=Hydrogenobacter sp. Uz 6-8 TaxID=3384828 RepID=UPI000F16D999|nr:MAG: TonB-system energizer ExbB [Aquificota bacterium]